jgi:hypothetical protein
MIVMFSIFSEISISLPSYDDDDFIEQSTNRRRQPSPRGSSAL